MGTHAFGLLGSCLFQSNQEAGHFFPKLHAQLSTRRRGVRSVGGGRCLTAHFVRRLFASQDCPSAEANVINTIYQRSSRSTDCHQMFCKSPEPQLVLTYPRVDFRKGIHCFNCFLYKSTRILHFNLSKKKFNVHPSERGMRMPKMLRGNVDSHVFCCFCFVLFVCLIFGNIAPGIRAETPQVYRIKPNVCPFFSFPLRHEQQSAQNPDRELEFRFTHFTSENQATFVSGFDDLRA